MTSCDGPRWSFACPAFPSPPPLPPDYQVENAEDCFRKAAGNGHLNVVKWLQVARSWGTAGAQWASTTEGAMDDAAAGGHLKASRAAPANGDLRRSRLVCPRLVSRRTRVSKGPGWATPCPFGGISAGGEVCRCRWAQALTTRGAALERVVGSGSPMFREIVAVGDAAGSCAGGSSFVRPRSPRSCAVAFARGGSWLSPESRPCAGGSSFVRP